MTQAAEIHPQILKMRSCLARLINLVQPTYQAEGKPLGELYRVAVDNGVDLQADEELRHWHELYCDYHDQYDIDAVASPQDPLEKVCPPLAQWLAEGMSPAIHFSSSGNYSVGKSLFYDVLRSEHYSFSADQLLGTLSLEEFCGYFASHLEMSMVTLHRLRNIVAVLPNIISPVYWHAFSPKVQAQGSAGNASETRNNSVNEWLPLMILDYTKNDSLYKQATVFFNPSPTIHLFKKLFGDGHIPEDMNIIDKVVNLSFGGWGGEIVNDMMPYLLPSLPFSVIRPQVDEVRGKDVDYLNFMIGRAMVATQENPSVFWPVCLLTDALLKNCGGLHASTSTEDKGIKLTKLLSQHPNLNGIIDHLQKMPAQNLSFPDVDIYNVQNQSIFINLLTPDQKAQWVPLLANKLAHSFKSTVQNGRWRHPLERSKLMFDHIHPTLKIEFSEQLRSVMKFPSVYKEANTLVWLQTLSLQGPESAKEALAFCHSIKDPVFKVAAAMELGIDPITLNASEQEAALYLETDLGL